MERVVAIIARLHIVPSLPISSRVLIRRLLPTYSSRYPPLPHLTNRTQAYSTNTVALSIKVRIVTYVRKEVPAFEAIAVRLLRQALHIPKSHFHTFYLAKCSITDTGCCNILPGVAISAEIMAAFAYCMLTAIRCRLD